MIKLKVEMWIIILSLLTLLLPYPLRADDLPRYAPHEILVKFRADRSAKPVVAQLDALARKVGVQAEESLLPPRPRRATKPIAGRADLEAVARLTLAPGTDVMDAVATYRASGLVEYAQPNYLYRMMDAPNDLRFSEQWSLQSVNWLAGWEATRNTPIRKTPIVAIIDSGLDYRHEDLAPVVWINPAEASGKPGVDDDGNGYVDDIRGWDFTDAPGVAGTGDYLHRDNDPMDESGHGTHVAGIVGAAANNGLGVVGICPVCKLMALRAGFTAVDGSTYLEDDDLAAAIAYAVENGADVINASWGDDDVSPVIRDAVRYAARNGVVFVAAAGNEGRPSLVYPAALNEAISVAALDSQDRLASFSNFGERLDLAAPGVGILSARLGGGYQIRSGTSEAAPCVAGLAAWVLAYHPEFSPEQVRAVLKRTATDLGASGRDAKFGSGRIDVAKALAVGVAPVAQIASPASGFGVSGDVDVTGIAAGTAADYRLEWGAGPDPTSWNLIRQTQPTGRLQTLGRWAVSGLPDAVYTLRLTLLDGSGTESRAVVTLDRTPPVFRWRRVTARLDSAQVRVFAEWETDDRVFATLRVRSPDRPDVLVDSPFIGRQHSLRLPDDLPEGPTTISVVARNVSGLSSQGADTTFILRRETISTYGFSQVVTLPDGFLINRPSDFDGNGRPEIALMPYVTGQPFSPVKLFEKEEGWTFREVFTSAEGFLPWNVGDVKGNGRQQLMGTNVGRLRLFEGPSPGTWPTQTIADEASTWGGDLADLAGNGKLEIVARSHLQSGLRILKHVGSGLKEAAFLPNLTPGSNDIGPHYAIADFDGDERPEIVFGDSDGDLVVYERQNDSTYVNTWTEKGHPGSDTRIVSGGEDLDGDGKREFIVARIDSIPGDDIQRRWIVSVYHATGDNAYAVEWQTEILGVKTTGNGIAIGNLTGNGQPDFAVCALPNLYIFTATGLNGYRPIWYTLVDLTYIPLVMDLDQNGRPEIAFNQRGAVRIFERDAPPSIPYPPEQVSATPVGPDRVLLTWNGPAGARYRIYRGASPDSLRPVAQGIVATAYLDTLLSADQVYFYAVTALDNGGQDGSRSGVISVTLHNLFPIPFQLEPLTLRHLAVISRVGLDFDSAEQPRNFLALPDSVSPSSAELDRDNRRVVLGFERELKINTTYRLIVADLRDTTGAPLAFPVNRITIPFSMGPGGPPITPFDLNRDGVVDLADFFLFAEAFGTSRPRFDFDGDGVVDLIDFFLFAEAFGKRMAK